MSDRDLPERIVRYLDGVASDAEVVDLNTLLRRDVAARALFVRLAEQDGHLIEALKLQERPATPADFGERDRALQSSGRTSDLGDQARGSRSPCRATPTQTAAQPSNKRNRPYAILRQREPIPLTTWLAAASFIGVVVLLGIFGYLLKAVYDAQSGATDEPSPDLTTIAVLFEVSDDADYTFDGPGEHDNNLRSGHGVPPGIVDLKRGTLTFKFNCDAEVTLKAPAKFYLNHPKRARLEHGELTAYCPPEAKGFTIGAPGCAVIDLGTRFWMKVDKLGFTDVTVREGRVNLKRDNGEIVSLLRGAKARAPRDLAARVAVGHALSPRVSYQYLGDLRPGDRPSQVDTGERRDDGLKKLIDGESGGRDFQDARWVGVFNAARDPALASPAILFDLGAVRSVNSVAITYLVDHQAGIHAPNRATVRSGDSPESLGEPIEIVGFDDSADAPAIRDGDVRTQTFRFTPSTGRFLRLDLYNDAEWTFISEVRFSAAPRRSKRSISAMPIPLRLP